MAQGICLVEGCGLPYVAKGLCSGHYARQRKYGETRPSVPLQRSLTPVERFWAKVDRSGGPDACWPWMASRNVYGYGTFAPGFGTTIASRIALGLHLGRPVPAGFVARHTCDNPPCCNPAHLREGSVADNMVDRDSRGRRTAPHGETHSAAKLSAADVVAVREAVATGESQSSVARRFGVGHATVNRIVHGKTWKSA